MPMSKRFQDDLAAAIPDAVGLFGTPFHIYDEAGILETGARVKEAFAKLPGFREYFAVKALPRKRILKLMRDMGFGFDCSSVVELQLANMAGGFEHDIMFTSNNTTEEEFAATGA